MTININPCVIWFTGLSGSGKTTIARRLYDAIPTLYEREHLDGDVLRNQFPTGFSKEDRDNHIKRVGFMCGLLEKHGVVVIASFISPYKETRNIVRKMCKNFIEVYISTPLAVCEKRDPKGLYKKARAKEIKNFTGISDPYEVPVNPEITIDTSNSTVPVCLAQVLEPVIDHITKGAQINGKVENQTPAKN